MQLRTSIRSSALASSCYGHLSTQHIQNKKELHTSRRTPRGGSQVRLRVYGWKPGGNTDPGPHRFVSELPMFVCCAMAQPPDNTVPNKIRTDGGETRGGIVGDPPDGLFIGSR